MAELYTVRGGKLVKVNSYQEDEAEYLASRPRREGNRTECKWCSKMVNGPCDTHTHATNCGNYAGQF